MPSGGRKTSTFMKLSFFDFNRMNERFEIELVSLPARKFIERKYFMRKKAYFNFYKICNYQWKRNKLIGILISKRFPRNLFHSIVIFPREDEPEIDS